MTDNRATSLQVLWFKRDRQTTDRVRLEAWSSGETGLLYVDGCMRALSTTGWKNFRLRAMLMTVASYHVWLDWRKPGQRLATMFTDYEPGIHWPHVQMQSGTTGKMQSGSINR